MRVRHRWYLGAAVAGSALVGLASVGAQVLPGSPARPGSGAPALYEGVSNRGLLQEALDNAVARALHGMRGADRMVRYRVHDITGEQGGIAGTNVIRVRIELTDDDPRRPGTGVPPPGTGTPPPADAGGIAAVTTQLRVNPPQVATDGVATFELAVRNPGPGTVRIPFASGRLYDFEVRRGGRLVWRWSEDRGFSQALTTLTLVRGQTTTYTGRWDLRNNPGGRIFPGRYEVRGFLPTTAGGAVLESTGTLIVTDR